MNIKTLKTKNIVPSRFQNRTIFDENYINEIGESIREHGIIQPGTVRPIGKDKYELVFGECRWRGAIKVEKEETPWIVRELDDQQAMEMVLIENLQRRDLDILDEAQGYKRALSMEEGGKPVYTIETLATRIKKSVNHIRQYLSLINLPEEAIKALRGGDISFSVARQLANVPGEKMRKAALHDVLFPERDDRPLDARKTADMLRDKYMRRVDLAPFDPADEKLVPIVEINGVRCKGGDCGSCPFRTGNNPEEFGVMAKAIGGKGGGGKGGTSPNLCTNLECFKEKAEASWQEERSKALKDGKTVLSEAEAEKVFRDDGRLQFSTNYVELGEAIPVEVLANPVAKKPPTWGKEIAKLEVKPEILVARDPSGKSRELVDRRQVETAIKLHAKRSETDCVLKVGRVTNEATESEKREKEKKKLEIATSAAVMTELSSMIQKRGLAGGFWKALLGLAFGHASADAYWMIGKRINVQTPTKISGNGRDYEVAIMELWEKETDEKALAARVVELLVSNTLKSRGINFAEFQAFLTLYEVDAAAIAATVKAAASADKKAADKKKKAKAPLPPLEPEKVNPNPKGIKLGTVGDKIIAALMKAPGHEMNLVDLAKATSTSQAMLLLWFANTGKRHGAIENVGSTYRLVPWTKAGKPASALLSPWCEVPAKLLEETWAKILPQIEGKDAVNIRVNDAAGFTVVLKPEGWILDSLIARGVCHVGSTMSKGDLEKVLRAFVKPEGK